MTDGTGGGGGSGCPISKIAHAGGGAEMGQRSALPPTPTKKTLTLIVCPL